MSDLQELTNELMQDPEFKKEYEALQPEMDITRAILDARIRAGMTQIELAEKSGISQADISRLEKGTRNPSIALLKRLAEAMDSTLKIDWDCHENKKNKSSKNMLYASKYAEIEVQKLNDKNIIRLPRQRTSFGGKIP